LIQINIVVHCKTCRKTNIDGVFGGFEQKKGCVIDAPPTPTERQKFLRPAPLSERATRAAEKPFLKYGYKNFRSP
jgi:hypothetical protein